MLRLVGLSLLVLVGCGVKAPPQPPIENNSESKVVMELNQEAVRGVSSSELRGVLHEHWEEMMRSNPLWATQLGDHRFDDALHDPSRTNREQRDLVRDGFLRRAEAIDREGLNASDQLTLDLFLESLKTDKKTAVCRFEEWNISPRNNVLGSINYLAELHAIPTPQDGANLLARYRKIERLIAVEIDNLRLGMAQGMTPNAQSLSLTIEMLDRELQGESADWPLMAPIEQANSDWEASKAEVFATELADVVNGPIRKGLESYRAFLRDELLPVARDKDHEGVWALPAGDQCYTALVHKYTTLPKSAEDLHETGLSELKRVHQYTVEVGKRLYEIDDLQAIFERLRTDPALYFTSSDDVKAKAEAALASAREEMVNWFGILPKADCVVEPVPAFEAPYTTIAYYRGPTPDGSRPGTYYVNVYAPETRPIHEAEVLAFHEAIPGHHLQIAIAQELAAVPAFRRHMGMTAFVEGWALYTEQLSDEMGLYSGDVDRLGMASFELWRAARLVVDTGLHAKGWSREQAIQFMLENTPLAENNIRNEVDRYITTPGQALSYKTGQLEIWRLRRWAEAELGQDFDIKAFHDVVLGGGAVSLPVLERRIEEWVRAERQ